MKLWRVDIHTAKRPGRRKALVSVFHAMTSDPDTAKALALAEWGQPYRAEMVTEVTVEELTLVARAESYQIDPRPARPDTIPTKERVAEAEYLLQELAGS